MPVYYPPATASGGGGASALLSQIPKVGGRLAEPITARASGNTGLSSGIVPFALFPIPVGGLTWDALTIDVWSGVSGGSAKILFYECDAEGFPTTRIEGPTVSIASNGFATGVFSSALTLDAGLYAGVIRTDGVGGLPEFTSVTPVRPYVNSGTASYRHGVRGFDPGSYASPDATIGAWDYGALDNLQAPWMAIRRSA